MDILTVASYIPRAFIGSAKTIDWRSTSIPLSEMALWISLLVTEPKSLSSVPTLTSIVISVLFNFFAISWLILASRNALGLIADFFSFTNALFFLEDRTANHLANN